jgi:phenylalanine-4-hydroxylase
VNSLFGELLPDWIDPEIWAAFLDNRKKMGKRYACTEYAKKLIIIELDKLRQAGNPPNAVLAQAIRSNHLDVWPLKDRRFQPVQVSGAVPEHKFEDVVQTPEAVAAGRAKLLEARRKIKGG